MSRKQDENLIGLIKKERTQLLQDKKINEEILLYAQLAEDVYFGHDNSIADQKHIGEYRPVEAFIMHTALSDVAANRQEQSSIHTHLGVHPSTTELYDARAPWRAVLYQNKTTQEYILSFRGTQHNAVRFRDWPSTAINGDISRWENYFLHSIKEQITKKYPNAKFEAVVGHSEGAVMGCEFARLMDKKFVGFCAPSLRGIIDRCSLEQRQQITLIQSKDDVVSQLNTDRLLVHVETLETGSKDPHKISNVIHALKIKAIQASELASGYQLSMAPNLLKENPTINSAEGWYQLAKNYICEKQDEKHVAIDCLELALAYDPKHIASLSLLGCIYSAGVELRSASQQRQYEKINYYCINRALEYYQRAKDEGSIFAQQMLVQYKVHGAHALKFPNKVSSTFDRYRPEKNFKFFENTPCVTSGAQSLSGNGVAAVADHHDGCGEHDGQSGSRFFASAQPAESDGSRLACRYDHSGDNGDLYKCAGGIDMRLGGTQSDHTRTATICRDDVCYATLFAETARSNGMISYDAPSLGVSNVADVRDFSYSYDRDAGGFCVPCGARDSADPFAK